MCFRPPAVTKQVECPSCGAMNSSLAKKCFKCKNDLPVIEPEPVTCPRCGASNPANAKACSECGLTVLEAMKMMRTKK